MDEYMFYVIVPVCIRSPHECFRVAPFQERGAEVFLEGPFLLLLAYTLVWLYLSRAKWLPLCDGVEWGRLWFDIFGLRVIVDQSAFVEHPGLLLVRFSSRLTC
jgi:hypothetical protein